MQAAVAAGHPATTAAGIEILRDGGSAADAAVAAALASCVAETVMTGLLGGAHAVYWDAAARRARNLDCFVAVPGLGAPRREAELVHLQVPFGEELVHYAIGPASCAVPGLPGGLDELWRAHGRLPWPRLVEPALRLARDGVDFPPAHAACLAMLAPVMTMDAGARIYSPAGRLLGAGERLHQPGLVRALDIVAAEGARSIYGGTIGDELLTLSGERGGLLTRADLETYSARWEEPVSVPYLDGRILTRGGLSAVPETVRALPRLRGTTETGRVLALLTVVAGVLDEALEPQAAVDRPRFHPAADALNAEPGVDEGALEQLERRGLQVRRWPARHHYFGGVSLVSAAGPAADPRRSGAAAALTPASP